MGHALFLFTADVCTYIATHHHPTSWDLHNTMLLAFPFRVVMKISLRLNGVGSFPRNKGSINPFQLKTTRMKPALYEALNAVSTRRKRSREQSSNRPHIPDCIRLRGKDPERRIPGGPTWI